MAGHGGAPLFVRTHPVADPRAAVLVLHGYSEHSGRYVHVLEALAQRGFTALAPDHRGHGRTARVPGDIESADAILSDVSIAHRSLAASAPGRPVFVLGHSMGALIGLRYAELWGSELRGLVVNGPAVEIPEQIPVSVRAAAVVLARVTPTLAMQPFYDPTRATRDPAAWVRAHGDPWVYKGRIRARTGAETMRLVRHTLSALPALKLPVLVSHGGDDTTVPLRASQRVYRGISSADRALKVWPGLKHETHNEPEKADVIAHWLDWIEERL